MQILFISDEAQILNFLSGFQAEAIMLKGNVEVTGISENSMVTVICSGESMHYTGTILSIDTPYSPAADGKWLSLKFMVRRNAFAQPLPFNRDQRPADA
jgi:hypothetical protein